MPYAANGIIAMEQFSGAIEITPDQYTQALDGMCTGLVVSIDGGFKVIPVPPEKPATPPESTLEELAAQAREKRDNLLSVAAIRIAPLQDAVDLGKANAAKKALLTKWKEYRVDLDDVPAQSGYPRSIQWPIEPS